MLGNCYFMLVQKETQKEEVQLSVNSKRTKHKRHKIRERWEFKDALW
jgi:hypothetical protein